MKRTFLLVAVVSALPFILSSQICQWSRSSGGMRSDIFRSVAADSLGNSYAAGFFSDTADFGFGPVVARGLTDMLIIKRDPSGMPLWARTFGGASSDEFRGIAVSPDGSLYVCGAFRSAVVYSGNSIILLDADTSKDNACLIKCDSSGTLLWVRQSIGIASEVATSVACSAEGKISMTGFYFDTAVFDSIALVSYGSRDMFIASYDENGLLISAAHAGGIYDDAGYGIASMPDGSSFAVTGYFNFGPQQYGAADFFPQSVSSAGYTDMFVALYDSAGICQWARSAGGAGFGDEGHGIARDALGIIYVTGIFSGTAAFGTHALQTQATADAFACAYDQSGNALWASQLGSAQNGSSAGYGISIGCFGNPMVVGGFESSVSGKLSLTSAGNYDAFIATFDRTDGTPLSALRCGGTDEDWACSIAHDAFGNSYIAGTHASSPASFGNLFVSTAGQADGFVAKFSGSIMSAANAENTFFFAVYPNPFTDHLTILMKEEGPHTVTVTDLSGRIVYTESAFGSSMEICLLDISPASYILSVYSNEIFVGSMCIIAL